MRITVLSLHTSPVAQPGQGDAGGMNVYVDQSVRALAAAGHRVDVFTADPGGLDGMGSSAADTGDGAKLEITDSITLHHLPVGATTKDELADAIDELILRRGADRQMVKGDALGDLQLRARAGCVAARTVSVSGVGCAAARTVKTARTVEAAGVGGEYVDAVSSRGERAHGLVDVDVHPSGVALAGLGDGRGVEGEDRNAHGDSLANDLGRVTNQKIRRGCAALRDVRATGSIRREAPRVGSSGSHGGYPRRQRPDEPGRLRE